MEKKHFYCLSILLICLSSCIGPTAKEEVNTLINTWYAAHPDGYQLEIKGESVETRYGYTAESTPENSSTLRLRIDQDMEIDLHFNKLLGELEWNASSFQEQFAFVNIYNIKNDIAANGWAIYPETPSSSHSEITFSNVSKSHLMFEIHWETYTVRGDQTSPQCEEERNIQDKGLPEECFIHVDKRLPLVIRFDNDI